MQQQSPQQTSQPASTQPAQPAQPAQTQAARRLDGKITAATIRSEIGAAVTEMVSARGESCRPGLAVVIVGDRADSATYVRAKRKACAEVGIQSFGYELSADVSQSELEDLLRELNGRSDVHGILVQLPLPKHIDEQAIVTLVDVEKDVDGFNQLSMGQVAMGGQQSLAIPCTPKGCVELLDRHEIQLEGRHAVVIGRSNIVGLPLALLLMRRNCTVTICHSRTVDTEQYVRQADLVFAACGIPKFVQADWIKEGAVVVDVGIHAVDDASKKKGYRLVGDVDFDQVAPKCSWITPVPGGVGPMTIAMLLQNTLAASKRQLNF